jgi:hypothetical protein
MAQIIMMFVFFSSFLLPNWKWIKNAGNAPEEKEEDEEEDGNETKRRRRWWRTSRVFFYFYELLR